MNKFIIIFIVGIIETVIYSSFLIALEKRNLLLAPILMTLYLFIYLTVITTAIKDTDTLVMLGVYAFSCGVGVFLRILLEKK